MAPDVPLGRGAVRVGRRWQGSPQGEEAGEDCDQTTLHVMVVSYGHHVGSGRPSRDGSFLRAQNARNDGSRAQQNKPSNPSGREYFVDPLNETQLMKEKVAN